MAQSLAKVYIHFVFSTAQREPTIAEDWREELFRILGGESRNIGCPALKVGGMADHVHMLVQLSRTSTIAGWVNVVKSNPSAWVNETRCLSTPFHWQKGYGAFSVSQSNVENVCEYIRRQPEHHATQSYQDEFREWLKRYEIEWDERYVWD